MEFKLKKIKEITLVGLFALSALSTAYAGTVTSTQLMDNYVGADGSRVSTTDYTPDNTNAYYDTKWMQVSRTTDTNGNTRLDVTVNSNFVSYNDVSSYKFGDLFMMDANDYKYADACTTNKGDASRGCNEYSERMDGNNYAVATNKSQNNWEYAFDLGGNRRYSYDDNDYQYGALKQIDQSHYEYSIKSTSKDREWQAIMVNDRAVDRIGNGSWNTIVSDNLLIMSFDITRSSLATADQIALRWAMTCANDIIEVVTDFAKTSTTSVPEPNSILLMLAAFAGLYHRRKLIKH
jgi:hypothetical protein